MHFPKVVFLIFFLSVFCDSCKKYEDGPAFSIRSKKERISNAWKVKYYSENGTDKSDYFNSTYANNILVVEKNGSYLFSYKYNSVVDYTESGTWKFNSNKTLINFLKTAPGTDTTDMKINRLKEDELWLLDGDSVIKEYHLVPF